MKRTCKTCIYNQLDTGGDKIIRNHCFLNPPAIMPIQTQQGMSFMNMPRPVIRPDNDFCKEYLADTSIKPY